MAPNTAAAPAVHTLAIPAAELPAIGAPLAGGFYAGTMRYDGAAYALIVAPKATGDLVGKWNTHSKRVDGADHFADGQANTIAMAVSSLGTGSLASATLAELNINGYNDWYLPARDELELIYRNLKPMKLRNFACADGANKNSEPQGAEYTMTSPSQTTAPAFRRGGAEAMEAAWYWSSTQYAAGPSGAWYQHFSNGGQDYDLKSYEARARAVRRLPIQSFDNLLDQPAPAAKGVVIYGPRACGKTTHAVALAAYYGKTRIVDEWVPGGPVPADTLALTSEPHQDAVQFVDAVVAAGITLSPWRAAPARLHDVTVALLMAETFNGKRQVRSEAYLQGARAVFSLRLEGESIPERYVAGTAQADAYCAGMTEGHAVWGQLIGRCQAVA